MTDVLERFTHEARSSPSSALARRSRAAWLLLAILILVGLAAVLGRAVFPADAAARAEPLRVALLALFGIADPLTAERALAIAAFDRAFATHRLATALHIGAGGFFLILLPLQLWRGLRARRPVVHRAVGRIALAAGLVMVLTALYFAFLMPFAGSGETIVIAIVSGWYVFATGRAVRFARRREIAAHREWILRAAAVPVGVAVIRVVGLLFELALLARALGPQLLFLAALCVGWALTIASAEWWIRVTRSAPSMG